MADIRIFDSPQELYNQAARLFHQAAVKTFHRQSSFAVALSGGSTPLPLYQRLARDQQADQLDWSKMHFFWGDERTVGPDHPDSNFRSAYDALLASRGIPTENLHRIRGEDFPKTAARSYEKELLDWFEELPPRFDLILLGMGADGHTASLFPGTSLVDPKGKEPHAWVEAVQVPKLDSWRITFTPRLINAASQVIFLVKGADKAPALQAVLEGPYQPAVYPAQLVQPENGKLTWLIDQEAAADLTD